ncbi:tyrosine-protein kinase family protein [Lactiplantibacillus plantarum]|uniref:tyrosine-protein kinase family protein n=1 Tax=Lactiplantibacillus plantarum TaxID=1590 RepID=UPI0010807BB6|nr:hypothetical protein [Lactiplantibacillus plantarum]MCT3233372.1 hypothetical protein [Lactiplantibacillus plantarum]MCT3550380.1 hypothetical protein [Lactiplantibacillus plantarum]MDN7061338.1 CpsD/CapB family tyrosine-protein kinase [Lactiplantibacillus plantarum]QBX95004.1 hypothetical protein DVH03_12025 [Lactiplantibacillus plantarum]
MVSMRETLRQINSGLEINGNSSVIGFVTSNDSFSQPTLVANLAMMYMQAGDKTLIIDTNFGSDALLKAFKVQSKFGLSDYLDKGNTQLDSIINKVSGDNLSFISPGTLDRADTKYLIEDPRFNVLFDAIKEKYNRILINTTPFKEDYDETSVFSLCDGVILVNDLKHTRKKDVVQIIKTMGRLKVKILGYVNAKK